MIQDRLTAKFLKNRIAEPKTKPTKVATKVQPAPRSVDVHLASGNLRTTVWL